MEVSERIPKRPSAPAEARRLLDRFDGHLSRRQLDDARLLVSEIVTNAVEHVDAEGSIEVVLRLADDDTLRVDVVDPGAGFEPPPADGRRHRGWGLRFVQRLSDRWGIGNGGRTRVWFELAA